jgi:hypothetical protein
LNLEIE